MHGIGRIAKKSKEPEKNGEKNKNKREYFENILNEQRIIKLGPKKRLLYNKRPGF